MLLNSTLNTKILPAAISYQKELIKVIRGLKELGNFIEADLYKSEIELLKSVTSYIADINTCHKQLKIKVKEAEDIDNLPDKAKFYSDYIVDLLEKCRFPADELEAIIPDDLWPLPKYSEMLFIM